MAFSKSIRAAVVAALLVSAFAQSANAQLTGPFAFNREFNVDAYAIVVDSDGKVYFSHNDDRDIRVHDAAGNFLYKFGSQGTGPQQFRATNVLAMDKAGLLYIPDNSNNRIQIFTRAGVYSRTINVPTPNTGAPTFTGFAWDSEDNLFVTDRIFKRIVMFDKNDNFIRQWFVETPAAVAIDQNDRIFVGELDFIHVYDKNGTQIINDFAGTSAHHPDLPTELTVRDGKIFALESGIGRISFWTLDGEFLGSMIANAPTGPNGSVYSMYFQGLNLYALEKYYTRVRVYNYLDKAPQHITFNTIAPKAMGAAPFDITVSSDNTTIPLVLTSSNPSTVSISGKTATIHHAGTVTITATQAGNDQFLPAATRTQDLVVNKGDQTIVFAELPAKLATADPFDLVASVNTNLPLSYTSSNSTVLSLSGKTITLITGGQSDITVSQAGNIDWNAATPVTRTQVVNKVDQTITFAEIPDHFLTDVAFEIFPTASSGLPVTLSAPPNNGVGILMGNAIIITGAGEVTITATQAGNLKYNAAPVVTRQMKVKLVLGAGDLAFEGLQAFPNPCRGLLTIKTSSNESFQFNLINTLGQSAIVQSTRSGDGYELDLTDNAPGIYFIRARSESRDVTMKIMRVR